MASKKKKRIHLDCADWAIIISLIHLFFIILGNFIL